MAIPRSCQFWNNFSNAIRVLFAVRSKKRLAKWGLGHHDTDQRNNLRVQKEGAKLLR
jgi:hypothetical protein